MTPRCLVTFDQHSNVRSPYALYFPVPRRRCPIVFSSTAQLFFFLSRQPENILLDEDGELARLCDFGFCKHVGSVHPDDLVGDPTTCYQSPERWQACHSAHAARARSRSEGGGGGSGGGCGVPRRDETAQALFDGDIFSAGVTLFMLVSYRAVLTRLVTEPGCRDVGDADEFSLPALNVFQHAVGGDMFGLLQAKHMGGVQGRLWAYW